MYIYTFTHRDESNEIINTSYSGHKYNNRSGHCVVTTPRCDNHTEQGYEIIPEMQEMAKNKASSDHCYDDTINIKYDNVLPDCTSNEEHVVHKSNKSNPTSSASKQTATPVNETHSDPLTSKHAPPKPIMKSIHKLLLRKRYVVFRFNAICCKVTN